MNKHDIHKACLGQFEKRVKELESAAKASASLATDEEHRARSKYDTFSLETSYLARGQAKRVEEVREALSVFRAMDVKPCAQVEMGALVQVRAAEGETDWYWLVPAGGGEAVVVEQTEVQLITLQSPIARLMKQKVSGDSFSIGNRTFQILSVT